MVGNIRVGIGGWTFEPWRGVFYPPGMPHKRELEYASRALSSIEINGTYYSTFKLDTWRKWRDETPDDFVFAVKASRYSTNRKILAEAGPSIERFLGQGLSELGSKLGPINWQFAATKKFDREDFGAFLSLLPADLEGRALRHVVEVRHATFKTPDFYDLARKHAVAITYAEGDDDFPQIEEATAGFTYARLMSTGRSDAIDPADESRHSAQKARKWAKRGDVFIYYIAGDKTLNPAAAQALMAALSSK
jgi:uncharacterized protein YecE (DUF72 family)